MIRTTPELAAPAPNIRITSARGCFAHYSNLTCTRQACAADIKWNWVSNLKPSDREVETLPLRYFGPENEALFIGPVNEYLAAVFS
ncbi:hypothetical protein AVEN_230225-1 [Araneus ventricosus]|uniref:Uncharacterized protein n=1 Tax=Araneus ventricosus TaxID=182803 RepID=A0A4Y2DX34_ARAVE|nr:hypothetical protein AVEN_230225-1 [Araneus ventricosus]